jgi:Flp pilus assembly protein TadG
MKTDRTQKGQALILIVLAVVGLLALTGLAVDGSATYSNRQGAQNAADTAALTGALDVANSNSSGVVNDAKGAATTSGFTTGTAATVTVNNPPVASNACNGTLPTFSLASNQYVQVVINTNVNTSFSSLVGVKQMHNCVDAIALGKSGTSGSMFNGAAIVATDNSSGCNQTMLFNGSANVTTTGGSIFDNCNGNHAVLLNGGVTLTMPVSGQDVGGILNNGGNTITPGITTGAVGVTMPAAAWSAIPAVPSAPTCSGNGGATFNPTTGGSISGTSVTLNSGTATLTPGNFSSINVNGGTVTFSAGTYCLTGGVNQNSGTLTGPSGQVNLVMGSNSVNQNSGTDTFADLEMYLTSGSWTMNGTTALNATKLRYYSTGSSSMIVNGGDTLTSSDSFFYLTSGSVTWNGSSTINLQAPTGADPYAGLVLYMPWSNTSPFILNGGSGVSVTGTILAPHSDITANGASNFQSLNSQIVGYDFIFNGGGTFKVNFNAGQNYGTPTTAYVELIK